MPAVRSVLVIGAGAAGTATAILLAEKGVSVDLVDVKPDGGALGSGITLQGNALRVFRQLGVWNKIEEKGYAFDSLGIRAPDPNGTLVAEIPDARSAEIDRFRDDVDRLGLRPTAFGVYVDRAIRRGRWLNAEESAAQLTEQIRIASQLGFTSARATLGMDTAVLDRVVPVLDELALVLTFEIQGSHTPCAPTISTLIGWLLDNPGTPVGLTLDDSVAMPNFPASYRGVLRRLGTTAEVEARLEAAWRSDGAPSDRLGRFLAAIDGMAVSEAQREQFVTPFIRFGHGELQDWAHVLPWVRHAHAKFWDCAEPGNQVTAPHRELVDMLVRHGYTGSISSEFGGIAWLEREEVDIFDVTRQHVAFLRSAVAKARTLHCVERAERLGIRPSAYLDLASS